MPLLRVAVGMSSGVDSAVSALILSKMSRRFELVGCFMRNWDTADETGMYCTHTRYTFPVLHSFRHFTAYHTIGRSN